MCSWNVLVLSVSIEYIMNLVTFFFFQICLISFKENLDTNKRAKLLFLLLSNIKLVIFVFVEANNVFFGFQYFVQQLHYRLLEEGLASKGKLVCIHFRTTTRSVSRDLKHV